MGPLPCSKKIKLLKERQQWGFFSSGNSCPQGDRALAAVTTQTVSGPRQVLVNPHAMRPALNCHLMTPTTELSSFKRLTVSRIHLLARYNSPGRLPSGRLSFSLHGPVEQHHSTHSESHADGQNCHESNSEQQMANELKKPPQRRRAYPM